jgi:hypothetical protein
LKQFILLLILLAWSPAFASNKTISLTGNYQNIQKMEFRVYSPASNLLPGCYWFEGDEGGPPVYYVPKFQIKMNPAELQNNIYAATLDTGSKGFCRYKPRSLDLVFTNNIGSGSLFISLVNKDLPPKQPDVYGAIALRDVRQIRCIGETDYLDKCTVILNSGEELRSSQVKLYINRKIDKNLNLDFLVE